MKKVVNTMLILLFLTSLFGLSVLGFYTPLRHSLALETLAVDLNRLMHTGVVNPNAVNNDKVRSVVVREMENYVEPLEATVRSACRLGGIAFFVSAALSAVGLGASMLPGRSRPIE